MEKRKIFLAGATGAIGRELTPHLVERGHSVVALARSDANEAKIRAMGATPARVDLFDADALARAMEGCDVVVRVATHISTRSRPTKAEWAENDRVRRDGTRALVDAAKRAGARRYVQESIVWAKPTGVTASAIDAERIARESGMASATLRLGLLYGPRTAHTRSMAAMLRKRWLPVMRPDTTPICCLHVEDAASAFVAAVEGSAVGTFDVVDAAPTTTGAFFDAFAQALGAPRPHRIPRWVGALAAGRDLAAILTTPMTATNDRFRDAFGWSPSYRSAVEGVASTARALGAARLTS